jgi:uncharacterized protein
MIYDDIKEELKDAMRQKDTTRLNALRSMLAAFTDHLVATKRTPQEKISDEEALSVILRLVKQRQDSIEQFTKAGRMDLVEVEKEELKHFAKYIPKMITRDEIRILVKKRMAELKVNDIKDSGRLIGSLMKELKGTAKGEDVKSVVEEVLK